MDLQFINDDYIFQLMLIIFRLAGAFAFLPAISDKMILSRIKIALIVLISLILMPMLHEFLPSCPKSAIKIIWYIVKEAFIGILLGLSAKLIFLSLQVVGAILSMQSGLSAATIFDPSQKAQISIIANFMLMFASMAIFASDTHLYFLEAIISSYDIFPTLENYSVADTSNLIIRIISAHFKIAFKLASPFIIVSIAILVGNGMLSRLMPSFQVFFVMTPVQILVLMIILYVIFPDTLQIIINHIQDSIVIFTV